MPGNSLPGFLFFIFKFSIMRRAIKHPLNYSQIGYKGQVFTQPSQTVPDQSLSIREILDRFARGLPIDGERVPVYDDSEDALPDPSHLDLAERQELAEDYRREIASIKERSQRSVRKPEQTNMVGPAGYGSEQSTQSNLRPPGAQDGEQQHPQSNIRELPARPAQGPAGGDEELALFP